MHGRKGIKWPFKWYLFFVYSVQHIRGDSLCGNDLPPAILAGRWNAGTVNVVFKLLCVDTKPGVRR